MSRIATPAVDAAVGPAAEIFAQIRKAAGRVPNTYAVIGALNPAALRAALQADAVLAAGSLGKPDQETIKLVVSATSGCDYCEAAHSLLAKLAGLDILTVRRLRAGEPTGDARRDALARFVRNLILTPGTVSDQAFAEIRAAGYSDAQLVDISLAVAVITFTNVFNRINDTDLDFPAVD